MSRHALARDEPSEPNFIAAGSMPAEIIGVETGGGDRRPQIIAVNAGEEIGVDDVGGAAVDDRLLVAGGRVGFLGRDEGRADIGEVGARGLRGENGGRRSRSLLTGSGDRRTRRGFPGSARTATSARRARRRPQQRR